jgi:Family of unknown function (DUF5985)
VLTVHEFLWGMLTMATLMASVFFLRYWRMGRDRFFLFLSLAFLAMSATWIALATVGPSYQHRHIVYLLRLLAFLVIIIGVFDKNRRSRLP